MLKGQGRLGEACALSEAEKMLLAQGLRRRRAVKHIKGGARFESRRFCKIQGTVFVLACCIRIAFSLRKGLIMF